MYAVGAAMSARLAVLRAQLVMLACIAAGVAAAGVAAVGSAELTAAVMAVVISALVAAHVAGRARGGRTLPADAAGRARAEAPSVARLCDPDAPGRPRPRAPAGVLPMLAQIPFFILCYQLFARSDVDGRVFGVQLSSHAWDARAWPVFAVLFAIMVVTAWVTSRRSKRLAGDATGVLVKVAQVAPFTILISAAFLPLAAGMYLATSTAWTAAENAYLKRGLP